MIESPTSSLHNRVAQLRTLFAELRLRYPKPLVSGATAAPPIADANICEPGQLVQIFDPSIVARVAEGGLDADEERKSGRRRQIARQLQVSGHQRLLGACVTDALTERIAALKASHPNFAEVSKEIEREAVLAQFGNASVTGLRLLLVGPPGVGKTDYALRLAEALGVPTQLVSMSTAQASAHLGGSDEYWSNTRPGAVFEAITSGRHANPIIVLDEIEKCRLSHVGSGGELRRRLASGLATWVPRIESPSKTYVVEGAAGCGKTQLALGLLREACGRGERVLYACFNRALADHLAQMAPSHACVDTLHGIAREFIERRGDRIDFSRPDVFDWMIEQLTAHHESERGPYDLVILDEGQDFAPDWVSTVDSMGHGEHRLYLLQDDDQRLYRREPFGLEGATMIRTRENFRSPQVVVEMINLLELTPLPIEARSPVAGEAPNVEPYPEGNDRALVKATETAIRRCIAAGYRPDQIAVVSWQGLRSSALHDTRELAGLQIKTFTGKYDPAGNALYTDGQLELETVFRFKGRSMEAIVFTEIDFDVLDAETSRRLYVGMTRARAHLELVTSHRAARRIADRIQGVDGLITAAE